MSDVMTQEQLSVPYNPNLLVTYKCIPETYAAPESPTFCTDKVTQIEWDLHNGRTAEQQLAKKRSDINWLEEQVGEWYDPNYTKDEVLQAIIDHFGFNPTKEMQVYGTVTFSGTISIPYAEVEDFDLSNVTIDAELSSYDYEADLTVDDVSLEHN
jgi:hypothetical protein